MDGDAVHILAEEGDRLWLYKPAGLPCFPPHADPAGDCVLHRLRLLRTDRDGAWPHGFEGGIAHRLDNATDGLLLVASDVGALGRIRGDWPRLRKFYRFRSHGVAEAGVVELPIAHHPNRRDRMVVRRGPRTPHRGRWYEAWTRFVPAEGEGWEAEIRTGVMHQVRVHAAAAGIPLVGDEKYGGAPGKFELTHVFVEGPGWRSPDLRERR